MNSRAAGLALASSVLAACAVGPNYRRPAVSVPEEIRGQIEPAEAASLADQPWWELFHDEALKALIGEALRNGYDLRLASWRVEEARALAGVAGAQYWPQAQAAVDWARSRSSPYAAISSVPTNLVTANLGISWELDLWGRVRRLNQAALAQYLATEEARRGVLISLVADVATAYFDLRKLDLQLEIARRSASAFEQIYELFNRRLQGGAASALETSSAQASLASTSANIPGLQSQIATQENRLALLLGRNPGPIPRGAALADQYLPPAVPAGLPSALLERRPDLREAEQALIAANANLGVATANMFPAISLTAAGGGVAPQVTKLFGDGKTWSVGGGLLTPILQGGQLKHLRRAAQAEWEQAKARYEQSVTSAFGETSTALVAYQRLAEVEAEQDRAVGAYREAVRLSNMRYVAGLADYLEVLQAQQQQLTAENTLAETRFDRLAALVELYEALGGGWQLSPADWLGPQSSGAPSAPGR